MRFLSDSKLKLSGQFIVALKTSPVRHYVIAQRAGLHPSTLSRILNGIEKITFGDPRVLRIGKVLGLQPDDLFDSRNDNAGQQPGA